MTVSQYLRSLRQQWWLVAILLAAGLAVAGAYLLVTPRQYEAKTQLFVSVRIPDSDASQLTQGSVFTQQRVKTYANVITSPDLLATVITKLKLPYTVDELASRVTAESPLDTILIDVGVRDESPQRAADIANTIASGFPAIVADLETPLGQSNSPVKVSVTEKAAVPSSPVAPKVPLIVGLGLILGLGAGVTTALLREQFNTTIRSRNEIESLTGASPLGVVPFDRKAQQHAFPGSTDPVRAEAFRALRTNLQFTDVDGPARVIVVTSALPGEGKTTVACNIALSLAASGAQTVLVEGDLRRPVIGQRLGMSAGAGLSSVLAGRHQLLDALVTVGVDNLQVLLSGPRPPNPAELLGSTHMVGLIKSLQQQYDFVIIDAPPLNAVTDGAILAAMADGVLFVVRHGLTRRENVAQATSSLEAVKARLLGTVLNFSPYRRDTDYGYGQGDPMVVPERVDGAARSARPRRGTNGHRAAPAVEGRLVNGHESMDPLGDTVDPLLSRSPYPPPDLAPERPQGPPRRSRPRSNR